MTAGGDGVVRGWDFRDRLGRGWEAGDGMFFDSCPGERWSGWADVVEGGRGVLALAVGGGMWVAAGKEWRDGEAGVEIWWVGGE